jgi:transcriptional regulator with XRE-family HTH domain
MPTLGAFIRRRRLELGLTQETLAEMIGGGVRQAEISRLEHDRVTLPRRQRLEQIATALEVPIGELLVRSGWTGAGEIDASNTIDQAEIDQLRAMNEELQSRAERLESTVGVLATSNVALRSHIAGVETQSRQQVVDQVMQPVLDAVIDPVIIIDESGSVVSENAAFTDLRHSNGGMNRLTTLDGNPITGVMGAFKPGRSDEEFVQSVVVINGDDSRSWHEVHVRPVRLDDGTRVSVVTVKACDAPD